MTQNIKLGFSTGTLYKHLETKEAISVIKKLGCKVIELGFVKADNFFSNQLEKIEKPDLERFEYVSFHAPKFNYENNEETKNILKRISKFHKTIRQLDLVVFHPDTVKDFSIFNKIDFNVGFENMDRRKESCRSVDDIEVVLLKDQKFRFVLDINHAYTNDPTMKLAEEFYKRLGNKITQIHLSGFKDLHDPLFETKQLEIIKAVQDLNAPIIIESILTPETIMQERDYILKNI